MNKSAAGCTHQHELLVTYEGPLHPQCSYSRKTFCISVNTTRLSSQDVLDALSLQTGWPSSMLHLRHTNLLPTHSIQLVARTIYQHAPLTAAIHPRHALLLGGKGGFGTLLKGQSKQAGARQTLDFGACRDLSGRRLRHVNDEIKLRKFQALQEARERGDAVDELAALKTESGIRNWHLMVPNWSDGASMSNKGRRKHERQLEREVRGWRDKEEREKRRMEQKRMDEEWAIHEYVRRGEVEGGRVGSGDAVKEGMLAQLRKKKEEEKQKKKLLNDVSKQDVPTAFGSVDKESEGYTSMSHLMTLSGDVSVYDIPDGKQQLSVRLQSQSDFATVVVLLDGVKLTSCIQDGKTGMYIEYTIQSAGLAQIGWIRSPDPKSEDSPRFLPSSDTGDGVGDDAASFGYDGSRGMKFHNGKEESYGKDQSWKTGDKLVCRCRLSGKHTIEIGYSLNDVDLGVAFSLDTSSDDLCRYFPAVSLNLGEVVDMHLESISVLEGCINVSSLIATEDEVMSNKVTDTKNAELEVGSSSPPKKRAREDINLKPRSTDQTTKPADKSQNDKSQNDDTASFDLNSCESVNELLAMDQAKLKNILLSMGVKCGGTPKERAERLFSLKGLKREDYPTKVRGKNFIL